MYSKLAFKVSIIFFVLYSISATFGSIFLITWGHSSVFKNLILFMLNFPMNWSYLVVNYSIVFLLLNVVFWSFFIYAIVFLVEYIIKKVLSKLR